MNNEIPNFYYVKTFEILANDLFEINNAFEIYSLQKNKNIVYLCGSHEHRRHILEIFQFEKENFKKIISLKDHKEFISSCKYFLNKKTGKEYLISIDYGQRTSNSIIWKIIDEKNYQNILMINNDIGRIRYPFSLIFNYMDNDINEFYYIYPSTDADSLVITDKNEIFTKIIFTVGKIFYYIIWENHRNNKNTVIQCNKDYVYLYDIFGKKNEYNKIEYPEITGNNYSACISYNKNDTDILCIINESKNIVFYDLLKNNLYLIVKTNDNALVNVCEFNPNYLIILSKNGHLLVFDYYNKNIITKISSKQLNKVKTIKMINYKNNKYLLIGGFMIGLLLFKNKENVF
jgi:hypothetical protein